MDLGEAYRRTRERLGVVREPVVPRANPSELALQAAWFGGQFGTEFLTESGRRVFIHSFGGWNGESGPDFRDARVSFDDGEPLRGDIELDVDVRDWERHGHHANPEFERVILHLFFRGPGERCFTRTQSHHEVEQVCLDAVAIQDGESRPRGGIQFRGTVGIAPKAAEELVRAAAIYRLDRKSTRFRRAADLHGLNEALFHHIATALGYKANKIPFLLVAQRATLRAALRPDGEALLFGLGGFLEEEIESTGEPLAGYLRGLWKDWWRQRAKYSRLILPRSAWNWGGIRPANHPHRRMGSLAGLAPKMGTLAAAVRDADLDLFRGTLSGLVHPFWSSRFSLQGKELERAGTLLGDSRIGDIVANVFFPAARIYHPDVANRMFEERIAQAGAPVRAVSELLGLDQQTDRKFRTSMGLQQGMLQLASDIAERDAQELVSDFLRR